MARRVVVTGMGIWSCLGTNLSEVKQSLYEGRSGIGIERERLNYGYQSALTGVVQHPVLKGLLHRRLRAGLSEEAEYAYMAARECFEQAGVDEDFLMKNEVGVIFGNDSSAKPVIEAANIMAEKHDSELLGSGLIFQSMNSTVNMNLSTIFHLRGVNFTISSACASGSHSIGIGYLLIKQGLQDRVLVGGAQETNYYSMATFDALGAFSKHMDEPTRASRPFDRDRNGLVPGGGAATLVLEDYESAVKRGAPILAEIVSWGFSGNGDHISTPNVAGPARSLELCLQQSGISVKEIGYVNAHATSTKIGDSREAQAIAQIFGDYRVPVTSTKSQTGHEMWMAGASEIIYTMLMMKNDFIAGNVNFENPDEETACINVIPETIEQHFDTFLSNSFGFGGTNSTLIVRNIK